MVAVHPMTYPYYEVPPEVHEGLADILESGCFESVEPITRSTHPPSSLGPDPYNDPTYKAFTVSDGKVKVEIEAFFDTTFQHNVAYIIVPGEPRRDGKQFLLRVERLLCEHGVVKK